MKRLERLGSIAFLTVVLSFVFHLIGMSFNRWKENSCYTCNKTDPLALWYTSLRQRCYQSSVASIFFQFNVSTYNSVSNSFIAEICIPNEYLMVKDENYASYCLETAIKQPDTICSFGDYDKSKCKCDYTSGTKTILAMTILTSFSLGIMIFLSHLISFIKIDYILKWLIPLCFILLIFSVIFIITTLSVVGAKLDEDVNELRYSQSLVEAAFYHNETLINDWTNQIQNTTTGSYKVKLSWCFGMEILALYFSVVSLVLYTLMFTAKKRPESHDLK